MCYICGPDRNFRQFRIECDMKALVLEAYNELKYKDFPDPEITDSEVLVQVRACGICGSDVHGMDGSSGRRHPPLVMGHEASGVITKVGSRVSRWKEGDRVTFDSTVYPADDWFAMRGRYNLSDGREVLGVSPEDYTRHGAFAELVAVPQHILYEIPEAVSFEQAALTEPISVAAHAVRLAGSMVGESCLIAGTGTIGIFLVRLAVLAGASPVIALDTNDDKLKLSGAFGADITINPAKQETAKIVSDATGGRGAETAFEAVGIEETVHACIDNIRKGGRLVLVGNIAPEVRFPLQKVVTRELDLQGSCGINGEYEMVLRLLAAGKIDVQRLISAVAPLSEGAEWFRRLYDGETGLNKVILVP